MIQYTMLAGLCAVILTAGGPVAAGVAGPEGSPRVIQDGERRVSLFGAAWEGDAAAVRRLVEEGADVNERVRALKHRGATPLMMACAFNSDRSAVEALIAHGSKINARDAEGRSVLMYAMMREQDQGLVGVLLDAGATVNARDGGGRSVLMHACEHAGESGVIGSLLDAGADLKARDRQGRTAIMYAARRAEAGGVFDLLIEHGASIDERDTYGRSVLMHAAEHARSGEIIDVLIGLGGDIDERVSLAAMGKGYWVKSGDTVLSFACALNPSPDVLRALLRHGADINARVIVGVRRQIDGRPARVVGRESTHLYLIAQYTRSPEVLDAALDAGALPTEVDREERFNTPLEVARMNRALEDTDAFWRLNDLSY